MVLVADSHINLNPNKILPYDNVEYKKIKIIRRIKGHGLAETEWGEISGPKGMTKALVHFDIFKDSKPKEFFFPIHYSDWKLIYYSDLKINSDYFKDSYALHLWNEMSRNEPGFDKNTTFSKNSLIEKLKEKYM